MEEFTEERLLIENGVYHYLEIILTEATLSLLSHSN